MFKQMLIGLMLVVVATIGVMGGYFWQAIQEASKPLPAPVATASIEEQEVAPQSKIAAVANAVAAETAHSDLQVAHPSNGQKLASTSPTQRYFNMGDVSEIPGDHYLADIEKNHGSLRRFPPQTTTVYVFVERDTAPGWKPAYDEAVENAMTEWNQALRGNVQLVRTDDPDDAQIYVEWIEDFYQAEVLGRTRPSFRDDGYLESSHVVLSTHNRSTVGHLSPLVVESTAIHELGHGLGLVGHSDNPHDVMYYASSTMFLTPRDIYTINLLYSQRG